MNRDWATGKEEEEEELTSCCCRDTQETGGFISADARMRFHLEFIEREGKICCHKHEDDFDESAGHHQKNKLHFSDPLRKVFTLLEMKKSYSSLHMHTNFRDEG